MKTLDQSGPTDGQSARPHGAPPLGVALMHTVQTIEQSREFTLNLASFAQAESCETAEPGLPAGMFSSRTEYASAE